MARTRAQPGRHALTDAHLHAKARADAHAPARTLPISAMCTSTSLGARASTQEAASCDLSAELVITR
eukprot:6181086-Pleurochrysis_carterae.AAC.1